MLLKKYKLTKNWYNTIKIYESIKPKKCYICEYSKRVDLYVLDTRNKINKNNLIWLCQFHFETVYKEAKTKNINYLIKKRKEKIQDLQIPPEAFELVKYNGKLKPIFQVIKQTHFYYDYIKYKPFPKKHKPKQNIRRYIIDKYGYNFYNVMVNILTECMRHKNGEGIGKPNKRQYQ